MLPHTLLAYYFGILFSVFCKYALGVLLIFQIAHLYQDNTFYIIASIPGIKLAKRGIKKTFRNSVTDDLVFTCILNQPIPNSEYIGNNP